MKRLFEPVDNAPLAVFRIAFGLILCYEMVKHFAYDWIRPYYIDPPFHFTFYGFDWVRPLDGDGMFWVFGVVGAAALCIALGLFYRLSAVVFFVGFNYIFLIDEAYYLNHFYLISLLALLLIFTPTHQAFSLDALLRPKLRSDTAPKWALWLLRAQIGLVYFFGGIAKLNGDWLQGEPMRIWLAERTDFPLIGMWFTEEWMVYAFSYGGLLFDLLFFPAILWRRTRWIAIVTAVGFHITNTLLFNIGVFPWLMLASTMIFLPPAWSRRLIPRWSNAPPVPVYPYRGWIVAVLGLYFAYQVLMPLRHFLYPGDVNWTEEGHRFSWHMKLRDKEGAIRIFITDPVSGETWEIDPDTYLNDDQYDKMRNTPDMILQFCHYLAEIHRQQGYGEVEVRVLSQVSLNGRRPRLMIDHTVNLAAVERSLLPADWIVPLEEPLQVSD
jgi:vitamin K-dependent gamma-carboxylase